MIDFKITFKAVDLFLGKFEKMSLISKTMFRKFLRQFETKTAYPPYQSLNTSSCQGNISAIIHLTFGFYVFLLLLAALYFIRISLIYQTLSSFNPISPGRFSTLSAWGGGRGGYRGNFCILCKKMMKLGTINNCHLKNLRRPK